MRHQPDNCRRYISTGARGQPFLFHEADVRLQNLVLITRTPLSTLIISNCENIKQTNQGKQIKEANKYVLRSNKQIKVSLVGSKK